MTKSQLLWQEIDNTNVILPFLTFLPHEGPITCVAWCPNTGGEHFCTGGCDREMKIWSTTDTERPICSFRKNVLTDCYWSPLACGVFTSHDDSFQLVFVFNVSRLLSFVGHFQCSISSSCIHYDTNSLFENKRWKLRKIVESVSKINFFTCWFTDPPCWIFRKMKNKFILNC